MNDQDRPDRPDLTEQDLAVATLVGRYIERRLLHRAPCVHDLLAVAAEFGDAAVEELRDVLAFYEAMCASETAARRRGRPATQGCTPWRACGWAGIGPPAGRATTKSRRTK